MNVFYTCDDNYVWLMGISTISLFENNKSIDQLSVYLLGVNISCTNKAALEEIAKKYNRNIYIIDVPHIDIPESLVSKRWPLSAFTRLFAATLLPQDVQTALYLDCDTIVTNSLAELMDINVSEYIFYGVKDCIGGKYKQNLGLSKDAIYINAGVILMNLNLLREIDVKETINDYLTDYGNIINYADQDLLNGAFTQYINCINLKYNIMTLIVSHSYDEIMLLRKPTNY